ncbi:hypothetical protein C2869_02360 [Saccharobesus litoralis]|uniref:Lipoprotein n=1 Tax=Saccharobesus litoralis TaxID=2172099 RepID=A0A2S0VXI4_9ALTE|nr:hypothetical protein [Saccharobesus litoralis]AWB68885.1 hypothetical protein C2869_02360 [Saccharobesus litoralis]
MFKLIAILATCSLLLACGGPTPVAKSDCDKVIQHVKSVLKDKAPSHSELTAQCKSATDEQRGCVMAADKPMKVLQCL